MTQMAHHINEMKRKHEHAVRIQEIQSQLEDYVGEDLTRLGELVLEVGSTYLYMFSICGCNDSWLVTWLVVNVLEDCKCKSNNRPPSPMWWSGPGLWYREKEKYQCCFQEVVKGLNRRSAGICGEVNNSVVCSRWQTTRVLGLTLQCGQVLRIWWVPWC